MKMSSVLKVLRKPFRLILHWMIYLNFVVTDGKLEEDEGDWVNMEAATQGSKEGEETMVKKKVERTSQVRGSLGQTILNSHSS